MEIKQYMMGTDPIEKREKKLFKIINELDKECFKLFSEVSSLDNNSYYKVDNLFIRVNNLTDMLQDVIESFDYLKKIELDSYNYASKRLLFKMLLTGITTYLAFSANALLGIMSFITLSNRANDNFISEVEYINSRVEPYDKINLTMVANTLGNASRILKGKMNQLYKKQERMELDDTLLIANNAIVGFVGGEYNRENILELDEESRKKIVQILDHDLGSESSDVFELLDIVKKHNDESIKLTKQLN